MHIDIRSRSWLVVLVLALFVGACDKKTPTTPDPPPPPASTYTVSGLVTDGTSPLAGVSVRITGGTGTNFGKTATTDAGGNYSLTGVTAERITIEASLTGYSIGSASPTISGNASQNFTLSRLTFTISGTVTDSTSKGVLPGVLVKIVGGSSPNFGKEATTNGSGQYSITGVVGERIVLEASATGYETGSIGPTISGDATLNFVLNRVAVGPGTISFRIDTASCGFGNSNPIVDVYIDEVYSGTIYNQVTPSNQVNRSVSAGNHTVRMSSGRGTFPLTNISLGSGATYIATLVCTS